MTGYGKEKYYPHSRNGILQEIFLQNFLLDRKIQVKLGNVLSEHLDIENGLPQGSSISVTLFAINDIFNNIKSPIKRKLFADDCNIYCSGDNIKTSVALLQTTLKALSHWSSITGFNNKKKNRNNPPCIPKQL